MKPETRSPAEKGSRATRCPWIPPHRHPHDHWHGPQWGRGPWGRPPRHWFFMKILMLLFWVCVACAISFFISGSLPADRILKTFGIIFLVMACGGMALRRMFGPLRMLMRGVEEVSGGNLDFQFPVHRRHGEINYLADQFNRMVGHIKEMIHSKDQLLLDVSHELRSPLTRMKVALEMSPKSKMRDSMMSDIQEMETMLTEILETERLKNGNGKLSLGTVDLAALAGEMTERYADRKPGLKFLGPKQKSEVTADCARVKTVLQNVLENALKFSEGQKKAVEMSLEPEGDHLLVKIEDFGPGIPKEEQDKIFEPFYRVDKSRTKESGGYGLGLSLCREIMIAHGGAILLESEPGGGTRVALQFPREGPLHSS